MYGLKPILVDHNIELPSCMYKMKPVQQNSSENVDSKNSDVSRKKSCGIYEKLKQNYFFRIIRQ
jgi:hypothetical protein